MNLSHFKIVFFLFSVVFLFSCSDDDRSNQITVLTEDVDIEVYETVQEGDELGTVPGTTNDGSVMFEIIEENIEGAFSIDEETGILKVADASAFNYNTNQSLTAIVKVYNGEVFANSTVTVNLLEVLIETEDITIEIYEIIEVGDELATVTGTTDQGDSVLFEIIEESVEGAFSIDAETGVLTVAEASAFDYSLNPSLSTVVKVFFGDLYAYSIVTVNLLEVIVETEDLYIEVLPFPSNGEVLGTVTGTTNTGTVSFEIIAESVENAFSIDAVTGELSVLDGALYDPTINHIITAQVKVANHEITNISNVTVKVLSDCDISQLDFENFVDDLISNQGYYMNFTMDLTTHEYTFSLSQSATVCSIGYQSYDETKPYLFEIVDEADVVLFSDNLTFSSTMQDYVSINPLDLTPGTYTIRRTAINPTSASDLTGNLIRISGGANFPFPMPYNSFMTFEGSDFYDGGGSSPNIALPYITLGFN